MVNIHRHFVTTRLPSLLIAALTTMIAGCVVEREINDGSACVFPPGTNADDGSVWSQGQLVYPANGTLEVLVGFDECLSSSCDKFVDDFCEAKVEGRQIIIEAGGIIESQGQSCTEDCGTPTTTCRINGLSEGSYELIIGEHRGQITLPSTTAQPHCAGEFP